MTILATSAIQAALDSGAIICEPRPSRIEGAHIDVTLGSWWWRFEPFSVDGKLRTLHLQTAKPLEWFGLGYGYQYFGKQDSEADVLRLFDIVNRSSDPTPRYIVIAPQSFTLMHTQEFIGTHIDSGLTCDLDTRSTEARWAQETQTGGAGKGDPKYATRWTLEQRWFYPVEVLKDVGSRIGSITFTRTEGTPVPYNARYNVTPADWSPLDMLPRRSNW
jgi:deoxycytidine triphosphate deaminase